MPHELDGFDPDAVIPGLACMEKPDSHVVKAEDYQKLLDLYELSINRAAAAEMKLQHLKAEIESPEHYLRALDCPHSIEAAKIVLHFDPAQNGINALAQLSKRLNVKPAPFPIKHEDPLKLAPPERQQLWILIDEALADHLGPFERGDICNILAPILAPQVIRNPDDNGLIKSEALRSELEWVATPLNFDEIRLYALRYQYLRDVSGTKRLDKKPMAVLVNEHEELAADCMLDSIRTGKQLDHWVDRCLFPKAETWP